MLKEESKLQEKKEVNFFSVKDDIENLRSVKRSIELFEKHSPLHDKKFLKQFYNQEIPMNIKLLNSELKEKEEINERLMELSCYLGTLRTSLVSKDKDSSIKSIRNFLTNKYAGISSVIKELNEFKDKINNVNNHYESLLSFVPNTLCHKLTTHEGVRRHIGILHDMHSKQKSAFVNLSKLFVKFSRKALRN